jgi:hypothetical protein
MDHGQRGLVDGRWTIVNSMMPKHPSYGLWAIDSLPI